jgi:hypothetical protein
MKLELNINRKTGGVIVAVAIIAIVLVAYFMWYGDAGAQTVYSSEREASDAITDISSGVEQVGSIIEDIDQSLEG